MPVVAVAIDDEGEGHTRLLCHTLLSIEHDKAHALILHTVLVGPQHAGRVGFYGAHSVIERRGMSLRRYHVRQSRQVS